MSNDRSKIPWHFILITVIISNIAGSALYFFNLPDTLYLIGFRFHLFIIVFLLIGYLYKLRLVEVNLFKKFKVSLFWQFIFILLLLSASVYSLYYLKLVKFTDPDFLIELGASSVVDLPLYIIWLLPLFYFLFRWYEELLRLRGGIFTSFIIGALPFFYFTLDPQKFIPDPLAVARLFTLNLFFVLAARSANFYFFYFWAYIPLWIYILAFGTPNINFLQTLLASRYDEWEGIFLIKGSLADFKFFIFYAFCLLLLLISLFSNRKFLFSSKTSPSE